MNLEELVVKLLGVLDAGIAISPDGEIHDDIRDALRAEKAEARCTHGIRRPHECKACADEPSKEEIAAFAAAELAATVSKNLFAPNDVVKHRSGNTYIVEGRCIIERDMTDAYVYRGVDGRRWVRPVSEMEDGRFVRDLRFVRSGEIDEP